jgi:hypothetical protein
MIAGFAGGAQVTASTGTGTWMVGSTPGGAWSLPLVGEELLVGDDGLIELDGVDDAAIGTPSLVRTQAAATPAATNVIATEVNRQSFISP